MEGFWDWKKLKKVVYASLSDELSFQHDAKDFLLKKWVLSMRLNQTEIYYACIVLWIGIKQELNLPKIVIIYLSIWYINDHFFFCAIAIFIRKKISCSYFYSQIFMSEED